MFSNFLNIDFATLHNFSNLINFGFARRKKYCYTFFSVSLKPFLRLLQKLGLIKYYTFVKPLNSEFSSGLTRNFKRVRKVIRVYLNYTKGSKVMSKIKFLIKSSQLLIVSFTRLKRFFNANLRGFLILHTSRGLLTHQEAIHSKIGGRIICYISN